MLKSNLNSKPNAHQIRYELLYLSLTDQSETLKLLLSQPLEQPRQKHRSTGSSRNPNTRNLAASIEYCTYKKRITLDCNKIIKGYHSAKAYNQVSISKCKPKQLRTRPELIATSNHIGKPTSPTPVCIYPIQPVLYVLSIQTPESTQNPSKFCSRPSPGNRQLGR